MKNNECNDKNKFTFINIYIKIFFFLSLFIIGIKYTIKSNINLINYNFINPILYKYFKGNINILKKKNLDFLFNEKKSKIENIMNLIEYLPLLKNSIIINKNKNKNIYEFFKSVFINKKIKNNIIKIDKKYFYYLKQNFNEIINYKWELIPKLKKLNIVRHIINNYYNEFCLDIFDKSLNINLNYFIKNNKLNLSFKDIVELMSKYLLI